SKNQRPAPTFGPQKKLNRVFRVSHLRSRGCGTAVGKRDKIEFQFAVPNSGQNQLSCLATWESRFRRGQQPSQSNRTVNRENAFFAEIFVQGTASGTEAKIDLCSSCRKRKRSVHHNISGVGR